MALRQVKDTPTNNFATWNAVLPSENLTKGNLSFKGINASGPVNVATSSMVFPSSGKWYCELYAKSPQYPQIAIHSDKKAGSPFPGTGSGTSGSLGFYWNEAAHWVCDFAKTSGLQAKDDSKNLTRNTVGIMMIYVDADSNIVSFGFENAWHTVDGTYSAGTFGPGSWYDTTSELDFQDDYSLSVSHGHGTDLWIANFGQSSDFSGEKSDGANLPDASGLGSFYYEPPAGALALCSRNVQSVEKDGSYVQNYTSTKANFRAVAYTGNGGTQDVLTGFQADLLWLKGRNYGEHHALFDSVRGITNILQSNRTFGENPTTQHVQSVGSTDFTIGNNHEVNNANSTFVAWCWKAGGAPTADGKAMVDGEEKTIANDPKLDVGNVTPTRMSVNINAGFSIVKYRAINSTSGTGDNGQISHGLSKAPDMVIVKCTSDEELWAVKHKSLSAGNLMVLNGTGAPLSTSNIFTSNLDTDDYFWVGINNATNNSDKEYIAYCWHSVPGYSKFGSYVGDLTGGSNFIYTGFRPAFIMIKSTTANRSWLIYDSARAPYNPVGEGPLQAESAGVVYDENIYGAAGMDIYRTGMEYLSNGFRFLNSTNNMNATGETHIYMAFAEQPGAFSNAR